MRIFKSKLFIGLMCLLLAGFITLIIMPRNISNNTKSVIKVKSDVSANTQLSKDLLRNVTMSIDDVPSGAITDMDDVIGKYTTTKIFADDFITSEKISDIPTNAGFYDLNDDEVAVSVTISNLAASVSAGILPGDIVQVVGYTSANGVETPDLLTRMEILSISNSSGVEIDTNNSGEIPATVTFRATSAQAIELIRLEKTASIELIFLERPVSATSAPEATDGITAAVTESGE